MKTELAWMEFEIAITSLLASSIWQQNQQGTSVHVGMLIYTTVYILVLHIQCTLYMFSTHCMFKKNCFHNTTQRTNNHMHLFSEQLQRPHVNIKHAFVWYKKVLVSCVYVWNLIS